jgi:multiple sugar transport system permease protein
MKFPGKRFIMSAVIVTQMFSEVVLLVGIYKVMVALHLQNTRKGLVFIFAAFNRAFAAWMLCGTFSSISKELEESAMIDGCNRLTAMIKIILPLAAPGIVTAIIFVFIHAWNEYTLTLVLIGDPMLKTLNVGISAFFGYTNTEWWYVFATSILATLPVLLLFQFLEKHIVGGLTAGSVKG